MGPRGALAIPLPVPLSAWRPAFCKIFSSFFFFSASSPPSFSVPLLLRKLMDYTVKDMGRPPKCTWCSFHFQPHGPFYQFVFVDVQLIRIPRKKTRGQHRNFTLKMHAKGKTKETSQPNKLCPNKFIYKYHDHGPGKGR